MGGGKKEEVMCRSVGKKELNPHFALLRNQEIIK